MDKIRYETTAEDRMNYVFSLYTSNQIIPAVFTFKDRLNKEILDKAIYNTLRMFPILSCCFVSAEKPFFELDDSAQKDCLKYLECSDTDIEVNINNFISAPMEGRMLKVILLRSSKDVLCIKISHSCSDGGGFKSYIKALSAEYSMLYKSGIAFLMSYQLCLQRVIPL